MKPSMRESFWIQALKCTLLSASAIGYTWPLIDGAGHVVVAIAVVFACLGAGFCEKRKIRTLWCILLALLFACIGLAGSYVLLNVTGFHSLTMTIRHSRFWYFIGLVFGIVFFTRSLSLRYRTVQFIEAFLVIGTLVYLLFPHRDFNLQNPREFADYLYSAGYDPIDVCRWLGIAVGVLALPMLFSRTRAKQAAYALVVLALLALLSAYILNNVRLPVNEKDPLGIMELGDNKADEENNDKGKPNEKGDNDGGGSNNNDENNNNGGGSNNNDDNNNGGGSNNNDDNNNGGGSNNDDNNNNGNGSNNDNNNNNGNGSNNDNNLGPSRNNPPQPVALAVFYDEYSPSDGVFHFRQEVLSKYDGHHLVASTVDDDVISTMPTSTELLATPMQAPEVHSKIATSMFLLKPHSQPPQLAMGQRVFPIQNPDPKLFVSAYGVDSVGLTVDPIRLLGRHSIPAEWPQEKVDHYLQIPDDPRYRALSDIIVRNIDPRFTGDDLVKAIYIKSWLEKEGYYTLKNRHLDDKDPVASFLFGSLRGYCVHFAHSAVYLLRSQGIAARVAIGYAVDDKLSGTNSAVLIQGNLAHAWPEIHVDGIGWVTFDIFPENGDEPPRSFIDQSLESLFGELARNDKSGGRSEEARDSSFEIPWRGIGYTLLGLLFAAFLALYLRKFIILVRARQCHHPDQIKLAMRGSSYFWAMYGHPWRPYLTLDAFARQKVGEESATARLVELASAAKFGAKLSDSDAETARQLYLETRREAASKTAVWRRILGWLNPFVRY
ncbi:MAG: hypothetical protein II180_06910 [Proteobacteria bacterium]|nr:hypothetical protein [Pseudomonadota bacterium]